MPYPVVHARDVGVRLEEVNVAANKMMMTQDANFTSWSSVKILSLYDNNLVRMGSLAPLVNLEELRISGNNLEDMPTTATFDNNV